MATITIENVPDEIVSIYWVKVSYDIWIKFPSKKRINLDKINNITYWDEDDLNNLGKSSTITSKSF